VDEKYLPPQDDHTEGKAINEPTFAGTNLRLGWDEEEEKFGELAKIWGKVRESRDFINLTRASALE